MLCQHLGFYETDASATITGRFTQAGYKIATGDLICYNTQTSETSCCVHLRPSTTKGIARKIPYARCKYHALQIITPAPGGNAYY